MMLAKTLKALRKANGFTQAQIADKLNIDRSTYSYYELGKINPGLGAIVTLSELYGISIDEIVYYNNPKAVPAISTGASEYAVLSEDEKKLIESYRKLNNGEKENVLLSVVNIARDADSAN